MSSHFGYGYDSQLGYYSRMKHRLKEIMKEKGVTQERLASLIGAHPITISKLVRGKMRLSDKWIEKISSALEVPPTELFAERQTIPIVGYVGAGAEIWPIDDHAPGAGLDEVELPWPVGENAVAVIVRGQSMHPVYREGDIIIYEERHEDPTHLIARECVVRLTDGRTFIKELAPGSKPGHFTLLSWNAPPIHDAPVAWAAPVRYVKRKV